MRSEDKRGGRYNPFPSTKLAEIEKMEGLTMRNLYVDRLVVGNTALSIQVDDRQNLVHVLDLDEEERRTLINAIDGIFQTAILRRLSGSINAHPMALFHLVDYQWLLYHTDGFVSAWSMQEQFTHIPLEVPLLHPAFVQIMTERRNSLEDIRARK